MRANKRLGREQDANMFSKRLCAGSFSDTCVCFERLNLHIVGFSPLDCPLRTENATGPSLRWSPAETEETTSVVSSEFLVAVASLLLVAMPGGASSDLAPSSKARSP